MRFQYEAGAVCRNTLAYARVFLAETEGFEPSEPFTARLVSSEVLSTTQPRLLRFKNSTFSLMRQ